MILKAKYPSYGFRNQLWGTDNHNQETPDLDLADLCYPELMHFETLDGIDGSEILNQLTEMGYDIIYPKFVEPKKKARRSLTTAKSLLEQEKAKEKARADSASEDDDEEDYKEPRSYSEAARQRKPVTTGRNALSADPKKNEEMHKQQNQGTV